MKKCSTCKVEKPRDEFTKRKDRKSGMCSQCRECMTRASFEWRKKNPETAKRGDLKQNLRRWYNMTLEDYDAMLAKQGWRCVVCGTNDPGGRGRFHVDHDHVTRKVRGLLCSGCNIGIGHMKENPQTLRSAADYIEYHKGCVDGKQEV